MVCVECRHANPEENVYCGKCGAELGLTIAETIAKRGMRDRKLVEIDIAEAAAERLKKWVGYPIFIIALVLGFSSLDLFHVMSSAKGDITSTAVAATTDINRSVQQAKTDVDTIQKSADGLKPQITEIQKNVDQYRNANENIAQLQRDFARIDKKVVDLGSRDLKANSVETTGLGPAAIEFSRIGCPALESGRIVMYCTQAAPETLYQVTASGESKPVGSRSPIGFQDSSTGAKPPCDSSARGTIFVEKGGPGKADAVAVCGKTSSDGYEWAQLKSGN